MSCQKILTALLLVALTLVASSCKKRTVKAAPPAVTAAPPAKPVTPASPSNPAPHDPPEIAPTTPPPSALIIPEAKPEPAKPRATPPESASSEPAGPKPAPPQISPSLSPQERAAAERRTNEDLGVAERNIQLVQGRQLNSAQEDLIGKIRDFLGQAREAIRVSDWVRAQNLAQKARVLSVELVHSL